MVRIAKQTTPPPSDIGSEREDMQHDGAEIPTPAALQPPQETEKLQTDVGCSKKDNEGSGGNWAQALDGCRGGLCGKIEELSDRVYDGLRVSEMLRKIAQECSIKFIAVLGPAGAGKSSIIKTLTGDDVYVGHSIRAGTTTFAMFPATIDGQKYIFIDTPGFNDPDPCRTDQDIFNEILTWLREMTLSCDLAGILYVHNITPTRFLASEKQNLDMLIALCGKEFFKNITIITTMWGNIHPNAISNTERRQKEYEGGPWKDLIDGKARVVQHRHGVRYSEEIPTKQAEIKEQEENLDRAKKELQEMMGYYKKSEAIRPEIQRELRKKVDISQTKAGIVLMQQHCGPPPPLNKKEESPEPSPRIGWWKNFIRAVCWFLGG